MQKMDQDNHFSAKEFTFNGQFLIYDYFARNH